MKISEWVLAIKQVRNAQKKYFKERTQSNLQAALEEEKKIDKLIRQFDDETYDQHHPPIQDELFT